MDSLALIQAQIVKKQRLDFPMDKNVETTDSLAIIQGKKLMKQR